MREAVSQQLKNGGVALATVVEATQPHQQSFHVGRRPVILEILQRLYVGSALVLLTAAIAVAPSTSQFADDGICLSMLSVAS